MKFNKASSSLSPQEISLIKSNMVDKQDVLAVQSQVNDLAENIYAPIKSYDISDTMETGIWDFGDTPAEMALINLYHEEGVASYSYQIKVTNEDGQEAMILNNGREATNLCIDSTKGIVYIMTAVEDAEDLDIDYYCTIQPLFSRTGTAVWNCTPLVKIENLTTDRYTMGGLGDCFLKSKYN